MEIRIGTLADAKAIAQFQVDMALESEGTLLGIDTLLDGVRHAMEDAQKGTYLVAEVDGNPVGSLLLTKEWSDWNDGWYYWIQSVFVKAEHRRKGLYRAMYEKAKQIARADGASQIRLYVDKTNERGQKTYQALGMHESHYLMYEAEL
ncbi:MAG: GNAT family N-acetyltransferase [Bacteroidaceae bacterium]|nr:GNAT family N-acetyltransferase [Bacteroidaceae bacterium]